MRVRFTALLLSFVLVIVLFPSVVHGDQLRGGLPENEEVVRSQRFFPPPSFLSFLPSSVRRILELLTSVPTAVITYIRSVLFYVWDLILSLFLFFSPISTTTMATSTATLAPTAMTMTSTPVTSAVVTSSMMTSSIPAASTDATMMMTTTANPVTSAASTGTSMMSSTPAVVTSASGVTTMSSTAMETTTTGTMTTTATTTTAGMTTTTGMETTTTGMTTTAGPTLPPTKLVFVTNGMFDGNLGGLEGGDMICGNAASAGNLNGNYLPWLSNSSHSPSTRFAQSLVPYVMLDGTRFADSFDSLVTDGPLNALDVTELNQTITSTADDDVSVWTGTNSDGTAAGNTCNQWKSSQGGGTVVGVIGFSSQINMVTWTFRDTKFCSSTSRLYCFQQ